MWFKRKPAPPPEPICIHEWNLLSTGLVDYYNGLDVKYHDYYLVGCSKCNRIKTLDSIQFNHLKKIMKVGNLKEEDNG